MPVGATEARVGSGAAVAAEVAEVELVQRDRADQGELFALEPAQAVRRRPRVERGKLAAYRVQRSHGVPVVVLIVTDHHLFRESVEQRRAYRDRHDLLLHGRSPVPSWLATRHVSSPRGLHARAVALARSISSAPYRSARNTRLPCVVGSPAKKGLPKNGFTYSQTSSPSAVTSKKRPNEDSQTSVLPFGRRCALPMRGEKKFQAGRSWYFHAILFDAGSTSITRENGIESSRRWAPLSKIRMLPFSSGVGAC